MEGDAGADRLNSADAENSSSPEEAGQPLDTEAEDTGTAEPEVTERGPSRFGRGWIAGVCAVLMLLTAGAATGGYFALRAHAKSQTLARDDAAAIAVVEDCVAATQAPDINALADAQQKIAQCATGEFFGQAQWYGAALIQAYQAADVHVQVSEMRTAVERENDDGSIDMLVAFRVKIDNVEAKGQEFGYRLRVKAAQEEGQYKIANLDQVSK